MLQEVHCTERSFETWAAEWGYKAFFSGLASNKAGVAFLFNNKFTFKVLRQICDKKERCIIIDLEVGELILTICNIYAPNKDDLIFFQNVCCFALLLMEVDICEGRMQHANLI